MSKGARLIKARYGGRKPVRVFILAGFDKSRRARSKLKHELALSIKSGVLATIRPWGRYRGQGGAGDLVRGAIRLQAARLVPVKRLPRQVQLGLEVSDAARGLGIGIGRGEA